MPIHSHDHDINLHSSIGRGPAGHSVSVSVVEGDPADTYRLQFKDATTGTVLQTTPNLDPGARMHSYDSDPALDVDSGPYSVDISVIDVMSEIRIGDYILYKGINGADIQFMCVGVVSAITGTSVEFDEHFKVSGSIGDLADLSVTTNKLANRSVTSDKLALNSVTWDNLASSAKTSVKGMAMNVDGELRRFGEVKGNAEDQTNVTLDVAPVDPSTGLVPLENIPSIPSDKLGLDVVEQMMSQSGASFAKISAAGGYIYVPMTDRNGIIDIDDIPSTVRSGNVRSFDNVAQMQIATDLQVGMTCHTNGFHAAGDGGAAYYTIGASGDIACANGLYATLVQTGGAKAISIEQLETVGAGVYTLGAVQIDTPIRFPRQNNRHIVIVDTVFKINTDILFPSNTQSGGYYILPSFVGCVFENATNDQRRVFVAGGEHVVFSRFSGCNFTNVDLVGDTTYVQGCDMSECYINSHTCFLDAPETTVHARLVNCDVESESGQLINAMRLIGYFSGTYQGNASKSSYLIECSRAKVEFNSCWFETEKVLYVKQTTHTKPSSFIKFDSCITNGHDVSTYGDYPFKFDDPSSVILTIINTSFNGYLSHLINNQPDEFYKVYGAFFQVNPTETTAFASSDSGKRFATTDIRQTLMVNKFITFNAAAIEAGTTLDITLECGIWHAYAFQTSAGVVNEIAEYIVCGSYESTNTNTKIIELKAPAGSLAGISLTAEKSANRSPTFTLHVAKTGNPIFFSIGLQKIIDRNYDVDY